MLRLYVLAVLLTIILKLLGYIAASWLTLIVVYVVIAFAATVIAMLIVAYAAFAIANHASRLLDQINEL